MKAIFKIQPDRQKKQSQIEQKGLLLLQKDRLTRKVSQYEAVRKEENWQKDGQDRFVNQRKKCKQIILAIR